MGISERLPWWIKIAAKLALARLPVSYETWRRLGLFRHGEMNVPERAISTYQAYYQRALDAGSLPADYQSLELGPGDSVLSGFAARCNGARCAWLIDAGSFADTDLEACHRVLHLLGEGGHEIPDIEHSQNLSQAMEKAKVKYLTQGTASLAQIADGSIDFIWSQVVLEHVPLGEFRQMLKELRRVISKNGIGVHSVDFRDHIGGGLNNLRFSEKTWESKFFRNSGFYTNRIRPGEMINLFHEAGFTTELMNKTSYPEMPIERQRLAPEFSSLPDEEFMIAEYELVIRPAD